MKMTSCSFTKGYVLDNFLALSSSHATGGRVQESKKVLLPAKY